VQKVIKSVVMKRRWLAIYEATAR